MSTGYINSKINHELGLSELNSVYQLPNNLLNFLNTLLLLGVRSKFLGGGEGVVDGEGGSSERCLKWGGGGGGH